MTRRSFLLAGIGAAAATGITHERSRRLEVTRSTLPGARIGLRVGFISDIHRSDFVSPDRIAEAASVFREAQLDLFVIGGDLITAGHSTSSQIEEVLEIFSDVPVSMAKVVVRGNHENSMLGEAPIPGTASHGFEELKNRGIRLDSSSGPLWVAGLDDESNGYPDAAAAFDGYRQEPAILIAHNPDSFMQTARTAPDTVLGLSGHLHGGQVRLPFVGPLMTPSKYPDVFDWGFARPDGRLVYVTRGLGEVGLPIRALCRPQICLFEV